MTTGTQDTELHALGRAWAAAERAGDVAGLETLLTEDFLGVGPHGFTLTQGQWLARYADGHLAHASFAWSGEVLREYQSAAVLTGVQEQQSTYAGRSVDGRFRATLFLVVQGHRWQVAAVQLSSLADGA